MKIVIESEDFVIVLPATHHLGTFCLVGFDQLCRARPFLRREYCPSSDEPRLANEYHPLFAIGFSGSLTQPKS